MQGQIKCFPVKVKLKDIIITKPLVYKMLKVFTLKKDQTMNLRMTIHSQLSTIVSKKQTKQTEQKQNHTYGDYLENYQLGGRRGRMGERCRD